MNFYEAFRISQNVFLQTTTRHMVLMFLPSP